MVKNTTSDPTSSEMERSSEVTCHMFMSEYYHAIDTKGRLSIPAKFREELGDEFVVTRGLDGCLFVYPNDTWTEFEGKLRELPLTDKNARQFTRFFISGATTCEVDKQGRVLLAQQLREFAGLEKEVVLAGNINRIEIWDKAKWIANSSYDNMDDIAAHMTDFGLNI